MPRRGSPSEHFSLYSSLNVAVISIQHVTHYSWLQDTHHNLIDTLANTNIIQAASKETGKTTRPAPWFQQLSSIYTRPWHIGPVWPGHGRTNHCRQGQPSRDESSMSSDCFCENRTKDLCCLVFEKLANNGRAIYQVGDVYSANKEVADAVYKTVQ
jgi:hypothetical protein